MRSSLLPSSCWYGVVYGNLVKTPGAEFPGTPEKSGIKKQGGAVAPLFIYLYFMALRNIPKKMRPTDGLLEDWLGFLVNNIQENVEPGPGVVLFDGLMPIAAYGALFMFACTQRDEFFLIKGYCELCRTPDRKVFVRLFDGFHHLGDLDERQIKILKDTERTAPDDVDFDKFFLDFFNVSSKDALLEFLKHKIADYKNGEQKEQLRKRREELKKELAELDKALGDN